MYHHNSLDKLKLGEKTDYAQQYSRTLLQAVPQFKS